MNQEKIEQLLRTNYSIGILTLDEITRLIAKAKPEWNKVEIKKNSNLNYVCQIELSPTDVKLDLILASFSKYFHLGDHNVKWQLVVAEGEEIRVNYSNKVDPPGYREPEGERLSIKDLFESVQRGYDAKQLLAQKEPSVDRTKLAVKKYLAE
jgi:hypothetical protein